MKDGLLTDRQMEVLRYRKQGLTQQQIADIISTSKANVCTIEKSAMENIRRAKETLEFLYTLDATHLCTIPSGTITAVAFLKVCFSNSLPSEISSSAPSLVRSLVSCPTKTSTSS